jgi:hypothetical protein
MAERKAIEDENPNSICVIHPLALGHNRGWQRFLEIMFTGIEQIETRKEHWAPIRDFHRIVCWILIKYFPS